MSKDIQITKNFKLSEFACNDLHGTPYPKEWIKSRLKPLCESLEVIREAFKGKPITITSGYRTVEYNKKVGGVSKSQHLEGRAADIKIKGVNTRKVAAKILELRQSGKIKLGGIGSYSSFTHYDQRGTAAYWRGK